jgi:hypothetical protein
MALGANARQREFCAQAHHVGRVAGLVGHSGQAFVVLGEPISS